MYCCISGQTPIEPVVTRSSGCLYERRLIEKYIAENGRCPKTGEPLRKEDLIPVASGVATTNGATSSAGLSASTATIPGLLQTLHHEWDAVMLEQFTLRQQLAQTQQELSHALFQHDAACRVIAKLIQERNGLKKALLQFSAEGGGSKGNTATAEGDNAGDDEDDDAPVLPAVICEAMDEHERRLKMQRKHRDPPRTLAAPEAVKRFVEFDSANNLHGNHGVTAIDSVENFGARSILSGAQDGKIVRYDVQRRAVCGVGVGHRKAVRCVRDLGDVIVSCSDDATIRVWRSDGDAISSHLVLKAHQSSVCGFSVLPGDQYIVSGDVSGRFAFSDIVKGFEIAHADSEHAKVGITCVGLHPDGTVAATGSAGNVLLWDLKTMDVHVALAPPGRAASIHSIAFNEDARTVAAATSNGTIALWDLRKASDILLQLDMNDGAAGGASGKSSTALQKIAFDRFGDYLAVASESVTLWNWKDKNRLVVLSSHVGPVTDLSWGADAKWIASASLDKTIRMYGVDQQ